MEMLARGKEHLTRMTIAGTRAVKTKCKLAVIGIMREMDADLARNIFGEDDYIKATSGERVTELYRTAKTRCSSSFFKEKKRAAMLWKMLGLGSDQSGRWGAGLRSRSLSNRRLCIISFLCHPRCPCLLELPRRLRRTPLLPREILRVSQFQKHHRLIHVSGLGFYFKLQGASTTLKTLFDLRQQAWTTQTWTLGESPGMNRRLSTHLILHFRSRKLPTHRPTPRHRRCMVTRP